MPRAIGGRGKELRARAKQGKGQGARTKRKKARVIVKYLRSGLLYNLCPFGHKKIRKKKRTQTSTTVDSMVVLTIVSLKYTVPVEYST